MTITSSVRRQFYRTPAPDADELIRIPPTVIMSHNLQRLGRRQAPIIKTKRRLNIWTVEEHERFLLGLERFPKGPWKAIAAVVGTKTTRQTMTHSQKYREKIKRLSERSQGALSPTPSAPSNDTSSDTSPSESGSSEDEDPLAEWSCILDWDIDSIVDELELLPFASTWKA